MTKIVAKNFIISFVINLAIACIAIFVFGSKLFMNDDSTIGYMFFGIITKASARTYYTNSILGFFLKKLHIWWPRLNWITLSYYVAIVISGTMSLYSVIKKQSRELIILWSLFELVFFHDVYIYLTFSVVAAFVALQSFVSIFLSFQEEENIPWIYIVNGACMIYASMLRFDCFLGVAAFAFVAWLFLVCDILKTGVHVRKKLLKHAAVFGAIIGVCFILLLVDKTLYLKGEWKVYSDYESTRLIVTDYRNSAKIERYKPLRELGVTKAQAQAVVNFRNNDPEVLDIDLVDKIANTERLYNYPLSKYVWKDFVRQGLLILRKYREVYFSLLSVVFFIFQLNNNRKKITKWWVLSAILLPAIMELFYFAYIGRMDNGEFPERCIYIVLMGIVMEVIVLLGTIEHKNKTNKLSMILYMLLFISAIIVQPTKNFSIDGLGLVDTADIEREYGFVNEKDKVYVTHYTFIQDFMWEYGAWQLPPTGFLNHCIEIGGWLINHPAQNELQNDLKCDNPYRALYEKDNVFYVTKHSTQEDILAYLRENYDENITCEYVKEKKGNKIYKFDIE